MLTERFDAALLFAAKLHGAPSRKGPKIPYLGHLLAVAALVIEDGGSEDEAIAALLHDSVEDQAGASRGTRGPALGQATPQTRLKADREGDSVVLKPLAEKSRVRSHCLVDSLPILEGRLSDPEMTFRREDMYGPDAR